MGKPVFKAVVEIRIPASAPHPPNTEYRIAIGTEDWDGTVATVEKVQMVYNGVISGRRAPSYPVGTDDAIRVVAALDQVRQMYLKHIVEQKAQSDEDKK